MDTRDIVVAIIHQDMRHNQLIWGLKSLGFDSEDKHFLSFIDIIAQLMGIEESKKELLNATYYDFLYQLEKHTFPKSGKELKSLAEACYYQLAGCCS